MKQIDTDRKDLKDLNDRAGQQKKQKSKIRKSFTYKITETSTLTDVTMLVYIFIGYVTWACPKESLEDDKFQRLKKHLRA